MNPIHGVHPGQGNPQILAAQAAAAATPPAPQPATTNAASMPTDQVQVSAQAQQAAVSAQSFQPAGGPAHGTAHQARAIMQLDPELASQPVGRIVSQVARGMLSLADVTAAQAQAAVGAETAPPETETGEVTPPATDPVTDPAIDNAGPAATATTLPDETVEVPAEDTGSEPIPLVPATDGGEALEAELIEALTEEPVDLVA